MLKRVTALGRVDCISKLAFPMVRGFLVGEFFLHIADLPVNRASLLRNNSTDGSIK